MRKTNALIVFMVLFVLVNFMYHSCKAQLTLSGHTITLQADTMEVRQAFKLLNYMVPRGQRVNKIVIKDGKEWYQTRWLVNRMLKRYAYTERNGKVKLVRI